jgi:hypothetical protein
VFRRPDADAHYSQRAWRRQGRRLHRVRHQPAHRLAVALLRHRRGPPHHLQRPTTAVRCGAIEPQNTGRCRAPGHVGAVRRPRRLHDPLGEPRPRRGARAALALLLPVPRGDRALRRHGREVHRRCRDGRVGRAGRPRGRRRAGSPRRARARGHGDRPRRGGRRSGSRAAHRGRHRRGRRDGRRHQRGHGRG